MKEVKNKKVSLFQLYSIKTKYFFLNLHTFISFFFVTGNRRLLVVVEAQTKILHNI